MVVGFFSFWSAEYPDAGGGDGTGDGCCHGEEFCSGDSAAKDAVDAHEEDGAAGDDAGGSGFDDGICGFPWGEEAFYGALLGLTGFFTATLVVVVIVIIIVVIVVFFSTVFVVALFGFIVVSVAHDCVCLLDIFDTEYNWVRIY